MVPPLFEKQIAMWKLREPLTKKQNFWISALGFVGIIMLWHVVTELKLVSRAILPKPLDVAKSYVYLTNKYDTQYGNVWDRLWYSIRLNLLGYGEATIISLVLGFIFGLFTPIRAFFGMYVNASRYIPLSAIAGIFVALFGLFDVMKTQFLAAGIIVYLVPLVVARIDETMQIHLDTAHTLKASSLQKVTSVFFPDVLRRVSSDIITLTAISWTYIIMAEMMNSTGGIGTMVWEAGRRSRHEQAYALLFLIVFVGFVQDKLLKLLDQRLFPDKYKKSAV